MRQRVAVLGAGRLAAGIAPRLLDMEFPVHAWCPDPDLVVDLAEDGVPIRPTAAEAAENAEVVIVLDAGLLEALDIAPAAGATLLVLDHVPDASAVAARCRAAGLGFVEASVTGDLQAALDGTLAIMAGGSATSIAEVANVLEALGQVSPLGGVGAGAMGAACAAIVRGALLAGLAEAFALGEASGAEAGALRAAILGETGRLLATAAERMVTADWIEGERADTLLAELRAAAAAATAHGLRLPVMEAVTGPFERLCAEGGGALDPSAVRRVVPG